MTLTSYLTSYLISVSGARGQVTDTSGLTSYGDVLAYGFGLASRGGGDTFANVYLRGAVINGILYGDTTSIITSVKNSPNLPRQFELLQNYPNPFNPITRIRYEIGDKQCISLKIYDMLGNEISTLANGEKLPGEYDVEFDASDLSSGIYFYMLYTRNYIETRKMILLR